MSTAALRPTDCFGNQLHAEASGRRGTSAAPPSPRPHRPKQQPRLLTSGAPLPVFEQTRRVRRAQCSGNSRRRRRRRDGCRRFPLPSASTQRVMENVVILKRGGHMTPEDIAILTAEFGEQTTGRCVACARAGYSGPSFAASPEPRLLPMTAFLLKAGRSNAVACADGVGT